MSILLSRTDSPGDAELITAVRGGDADAYGELYARHVEAARRLARQLVAGGDADDLVSEAFAKVLGVLQRGGGPDLAFRAYLLTAVRRLHVDRLRHQARLRPTDDLTPYDPGVPFRDTAVEGFESSAAARAFASLPERWQLVLWHTEVEGQKPADVAPLLGMSANSVSALAYRAREGLRQAFLAMHVQELDDADCEWTHQHLGAFVRGGLAKRDATKVRAHLDDCRRCTAIYLELTEVNSRLAGVLAPLVLGSAAAAYLAGGGAAVKGGALVLLAGRARDLVVGNAPVAAGAGLAATAVLAGLVYVGGHDGFTTSPDPFAAARPGSGLSAPHHPAIRRERRAPGLRHGGTSAAAAAAPSSASTGPSSSPSGQVAPEPSSPAQPTPTADAQPTAPTSDHTDPTVAPTTPSDPPSQPTPGLTATVSVTDHHDGTYLVALTVSGATTDTAAVVHVTGDSGTTVVTHDVRCASTNPQADVCTLTATPAVVLVGASAPDGAGAVRFVVTSADGLTRTLTVSLS